MYSIRVVPKYDDPLAQWDAATFEPNNHPINGYLIQSGQSNALISAIEERNSSYATYTADRDNYRFQVTKGETYTIEIFDVDVSLDRFGTICNGNGRDGIGLIIYNEAHIERKENCGATYAGPVHNSLSYTAESSGIYVVSVIPNNEDAYGTYSIRVIGPDDEPRLFLPIVQRNR